jgi:YfiH family protein
MTLINDNHFHLLQYLIADNIHSSKVSAIFTTRNGGVSGTTPETEHFFSMNLQYNDKKDTHANVTKNHEIIATSQGFSKDDIMSLWQRHSDNIIAVDNILAENRPYYKIGEADALVTNIKGILLSVRVADCVPILLYDHANDAIGAIHAGWRGTFAEIGAKTIKYMNELYGTNPANVQAAIGVCCFEVGNDVYEQFCYKFSEDIDIYFDFSK